MCHVEKNKLKKIIEKPVEYYLANVGVYVVSSKVLKLIDPNRNISFINLIEKVDKSEEKNWSISYHRKIMDRSWPINKLNLLDNN